MEILIATQNPGKVREVQEALCSLPLILRYLSEFPGVSSVSEVGRTYEENAALKAISYANETGISALADDSGLEVDALGGKPGLFSARFGGNGASDRDRIEKLLADLSQQAVGKWTARFVCSMALAGWKSEAERMSGSPTSLIATARGICDGLIAPAPRGENGFGFDPVFLPEGYEQTFAELPATVKAIVSHRARALAGVQEFLKRHLDQT
jgi:XTP/dITP diphosphohydrolase